MLIMRGITIFHWRWLIFIPHGWWAFPGFCPPFVHIAWEQAGDCLAFPPFDHPFPILRTHSMGVGWGLPGFSRLLSTLFPSFIPLAWAKGGLSLASPTFCPPFIHIARLSPYNCVNKKSHFNLDKGYKF